MLATCLVVWIATNVILVSATATTERLQGRGGYGRILSEGGRPARRNEFPYLVLLAPRGHDWNVSWCSGTIPSPTTVLSAALCDDRGHLIAYAGLLSNNETEIKNPNVQVRDVTSVVKKSNPLIQDIMICYVNESWVWTESVGPVTLQLSITRLQPSFLIRCQVVGFGELDPNGGVGAVYVMEQLVGSGSQCLDLGIFMYFLSFFMCSVNTNEKVLCPGDMGGAAVCTEKQWAVNRMKGELCNAHNFCDQQYETNVFYFIGYFRNFILDNIKDLPSSANSIQRFSVKTSMFEVFWQFSSACGLWMSVHVSLRNCS